MKRVWFSRGAAVKGMARARSLGLGLGLGLLDQLRREVYPKNLISFGSVALMPPFWWSSFGGHNGNK